MKRNIFIEIMRVVASFLVICIHFNPFGDVFSPIVDPEYFAASTEATFLSIALARLAVPFFFITSGYFLAPRLRHYNQENKQKIKSYILGIFKIFTTWALFYFIAFNAVNIYYTGWFVYPGTFMDNVTQFVGHYMYHLWYLVALITGVIGTTFLLNRFKLRQAFLICGGLYVIGMLGDSYYGLLDATPGAIIGHWYNALFITTRNGLFMGLPFMMLGVYLQGTETKLSTRQLILALVVSFSFMTLETFTLITHHIPRDYNMNLTLPIVSLFLFRLLIRLNDVVKVPPILETISKYCGQVSLYIYLTHVLVIVIYRDILQLENRLLSFSLVAMTTIGLSILLTLHYNKLPNPKPLILETSDFVIQKFKYVFGQI